MITGKPALSVAPKECIVGSRLRNLSNLSRLWYLYGSISGAVGWRFGNVSAQKEDLISATTVNLSSSGIIND